MIDIIIIGKKTFNMIIKFHRLSKISSIWNWCLVFFSSVYVCVCGTGKKFLCTNFYLELKTNFLNIGKFIFTNIQRIDPIYRLLVFSGGQKHTHTHTRIIIQLAINHNAWIE